MQTLKKVADQVLEIMAQHIPEGQVAVFLAALYQAHLYTAARDHLNGGRSGRCSHTPGSQQLGYHSINDPVICSSNSGSRFRTQMYSSAGADRIHAHTPEGVHDGSDFIVSQRTSPGWKAQLPIPSTWGMRLILGYHRWASPPRSRLWSRVQAATANPSPAPLS